MSVGPQLQLAVLWPWLLMAMLQIRLGYSGLALVAAMEAERTLAQKAIIRVIPFKLEPLTLEGVFASIAEITPAEGKLLQVSKSLFCCTCSVPWKICWSHWCFLGAKASINVTKEKERHLPFHWATGTNRLSPKSDVPHGKGGRVEDGNGKCSRYGAFRNRRDPSR
ncbi:hypothetical protein E2320_018258 [Naja naja]|nr:hypothetical protein E2320_018258 [Naja naja]